MAEKKNTKTNIWHPRIPSVCRTPALYANFISLISLYKMILGKYCPSQYSAFFKGREQEPVSIVWLETHDMFWVVTAERSVTFDPWAEMLILHEKMMNYCLIMEIKTNLSILSHVLDFHYIASYLKSNSIYVR